MRTSSNLVTVMFFHAMACCVTAVSAGQSPAPPSDATTLMQTAAGTGNDTARTKAWRQDLDVLLARLRRIHPRPFARLSEAEVNAEHRKLAAAIPRMSDEQVVLAMMALMARMTGGHTQLYGTSAKTISTRWFPVRFFAFRDGIGITATSTDHADLAGARVLRIGDLDARAAMETVMRITPADNDVGKLHRAPYFMMMDWVLHGLGITPDRDELTLVVEGPGDRPRRKVTLAAQDRRKDDALSYQATESVVGGQAVIGRPEDSVSTALYLRHTDRRFWLAYLPGARALYVQVRFVGNGPHESLTEFAHRVWTLADSVPVDRFILDLRFARGGNKTLADPLLDGLLAHPALNTPGAVFTLIGRETFSAGMMLAVYLEEHSNTVFVGEPTGASPNFSSETLGISLPNSGLIASVGEWYWVNSVPWDTRPAIDPDISTPFSLDDYRSGRDPALDAVLSDSEDHAALARRVLPQRRRQLNRVKLAHAAIMRDLAAGEPVTELELRDIGRALVSSGDYEMGLELLSAWVEHFPGSSDALVARAQGYVQAGDTARARQDLRDALLRSPDDAEAKAMLRDLGGT